MQGNERKPEPCGRTYAADVGDDGEPVQPWLLHCVRRIRRWRRGVISHWACAHVTVGQLPDGRWFVEHTGTGFGARAWPDEQRAHEAAEQLMRDGEEWQEVPAQYGLDGQPTEPGWVRRGGTWFRDTTTPVNRPEAPTAGWPPAP